MKSRFIPLLALLFATVFFTSCDKADMKVKKLNHGDGTWTITSMHYEYYDAAGHAVVSDSTVTNPGEIVFFKTTTLDALFDYHLAVINMMDAGGNITGVYSCGVYFDESRADFEQNADLGPVPAEILGLWSVTESSRRKQEWSTYQLRADGSLGTKITMKMKFR